MSYQLTTRSDTYKIRVSLVVYCNILTSKVGLSDTVILVSRLILKPLFMILNT